MPRAKRRTTTVHVLDNPKFCPLCLALAVVQLTPEQLAEQPDNTTHVCHPALGGCNHGFGPTQE